MKVELCDLCEKRVDELNSTKVIIKDYKGITCDYNTAFPSKQEFEGVICDDCLNLLRENQTIRLKVMMGEHICKSESVPMSYGDAANILLDKMEQYYSTDNVTLSQEGIIAISKAIDACRILEEIGAK